MQRACTYRGRIVSVTDVNFIRELIASQPEAGRCALSRQLCEAWNWKQANGSLCDQLCRGLLLKLERAGEIQLPAVRFRPARNPLAGRRPPAVGIGGNPPGRWPLRWLFPL